MNTYIWQKNAEDPITYTTESPSEETIIVKTVATGNIVPKEEVLIKSNISGVIEEVFIEAGQYVNSGDLIAKIRVIPNISNLTSAKNSIASNQTSLQTAKINLQTQQANYDRQKALFEKGVISANEFEGIKNTYLQTKQSVEQAKINLTSASQNFDIIKTGHIDLRRTRDGIEYYNEKDISNDEIVFFIDLFKNDIARAIASEDIKDEEAFVIRSVSKELTCAIVPQLQIGTFWRLKVITVFRESSINPFNTWDGQFIITK